MNLGGLPAVSSRYAVAVGCTLAAGVRPAFLLLPFFLVAVAFVVAFLGANCWFRLCASRMAFWTFATALLTAAAVAF